MIQTWVFKILIILHPSPGACSQTILWTLALKELSAALSGNKGVVWRGFKSRRSCKHLQTSQMLCFCKLRICDLVSALDMKRLKKVQVSVALKEFEAVDFVTRAIADVFFDASAVQTWSDLSFDPASSITDVDSVCALSQMSWFSKKYQQFASVWCLSLRFCMSTLKAMSSNVKQCQAMSSSETSRGHFVSSDREWCWRFGYAQNAWRFFTLWQSDNAKITQDSGFKAADGTRS